MTKCKQHSASIGRSRRDVRARLFLMLPVLIGLTLGAAACKSSIVRRSEDFFPLGKNYTWTYKVESRSQRANFTIIDRVVGEKYVSSLNMTGKVVEEFYSLRSGTLRPLLYYETSDGYLSRVSGLDYKDDTIVPPPWGGSLEDRFLPEHLSGDRRWDNVLLPYGKLAGSPRIQQHHRTFAEPGAVSVPAGIFRGCIRIETDAQYQGGPAKGQDMSLYYLDWYAPNVGLIKSIALEGGAHGPEMEHVELMRYDVSGTAKK